MRELNVIGLNSGTSMDGIDAALFTLGPKEGAASWQGGVPALDIKLVASLLHPFEPSFRRRLLATVAAASISWEEVCLLNTALGEVFADACLSLMRESAGKVAGIDLIGSHGQTIWHAPRKKNFWGVTTAGTLQLGEPAVIAARTGITVIADFRGSDIASGGEGAPLVCFADEVLFGASGLATGVLNLGGIANITAIDESGRAVLAFDTGPGNMLIDRAALKLLGCAFDEGGKIAATGRVDQSWLCELESNPYYERIPPKTTGREMFGYAYADELLAQAASRGLSAPDVMATLTYLTAATISRAYRRYILPRVALQRLIVGGGGAENAYLLEQLSKLWPHDIKISLHEEFGISTKFKEALLFALLAYTTFFQIPNNEPACTGASRRVCLGKLVRASGVR